MARSLPPTGWSSSCRKRRRISWETSRWAEKWSSMCSDSSSTSRRQMGPSCCTSPRLPYGCFRDVDDRVLANRAENQCGTLFYLFYRWTEASNLFWLEVKASWEPPCTHASADMLHLLQETALQPNGATPPWAVCCYQTLKTLKSFCKLQNLCPRVRFFLSSNVPSEIRFSMNVKAGIINRILIPGL